MRILAASDIHLGRLPTHGSSNDLPWDAVVNKAIELSVEVLLLAGDIIDQDKHWISSAGAIDRGLAKLKEAKIKVFAVGGNHDWGLLSYLLKHRDAITILGEGGKWEAVEYDGVRFIGWSFPRAHISYSPLTSFDSTLISDATLSIGLLHGDVDVPSSSYGPLKRTELRDSGVDLWVLGHIHKPQYMPEAKSCYCGSPYALDPSEFGYHGVFLIERASKRAWKEPAFIALSPIRYETLEVSVTNLSSVEEIRSAIIAEARAWLVKNKGIAAYLYLQPLFVGELDPAIELKEVFTGTEPEEQIAEERGVVCYVRTKYRNETSVAVDLETLATGESADALLARKILDETELLRLYQQYTKESYNSGAYRSLATADESEAEQLAHAKAAAMTLLQAMIKQRREQER